MSTKYIKPTESELEILGVLWRNGLASVREVHEELAKTKDVGYTTTLKLMQIMHEKGLVKRDASVKTHIYQAAVSREKTQKHLLGKMIEGLFGGSSTQLVIQALGNHKASQEELEAIQETAQQPQKPIKYLLMTLSLFSKVLGWALLNSLWQFGLLWIFFILVTGSFKNLSSSFRHGFALLLSITGAAWFAAGLLSGCFNGTATETGVWDAFLAAYTSSSFYLITQHLADHYLGYITDLYLLITGVQFARFIYSFYQSQVIYTTGLSKAQVELRFYVQKMASHLQITRKVKVFVSEYVDTPLVIGFLKPTILMPLACVNQLSMPQLEAILLHELAHIKRNDYLVNIYVAAMEILFFFNPFARMILESIRNEREHSCDDWVIQHQFNPHLYASALLTLEQNRSGYLKNGIAATGMSRTILLHRVQRIMQVQSAKKNNLARTITCFAAACLVFVFIGLRPAIVTGRVVNYTKELYAIASRFSFRKPHNTSAEHRISFTNKPVPAINLSLSANKQRKPLPEKPDGEPEETDDAILPAFINDDVSNIPIATQVTNIESRNFSIPDDIQPDVPAVALAYTYPYVPSSSFYFSTDTAKPRVKPETYHERNARESLMKTKKALNEINWTAIQKNLPANVNIMTLRKEIEKSIDQLNWQQINEEIKDSITLQTTKAYKNSVLDEVEELKVYKSQQQKLELLQNQLQLQQKLYKIDVENKALDVQKELTKHKIIVYL